MSFLDPPGIPMSVADTRYARPNHAYPVEIPEGLLWDHETFPIEMTITQSFGLAPQVGWVNYTPELLFSLRSLAFTAPFATFWASPTGSDTNPGTQASPVKSIGKLQALGNATGHPCMGMVTAGSYPRNNNPRNNSGTAVIPTVDMVFMAYGGKVMTGTFDNYAPPAAVDGVYPNCYKLPLLGSCDRIVNRLELDIWGDYARLRYVATPTICNNTPNSWCAVVNSTSFDIYVNRADGLPVTNANTRAYRSGAANYIMGPQVNVMFTALNGSSWDMEGSNGNGIVDFLCTSPASTPGCSVFSSVRFQQAGGQINSTARAVSGNSFNGLIAAFNCHGGNPATDIFNIHNNYGAAKSAVLTVNCTGKNPGIFGQQSCNAWTLHENCVGIDLCGAYEEAHGGTVAIVGTSTGLLAGTWIKNDRGDAVLGGGGQQVPVAVMAKDTSQIWCDSVKIDMQAGTWAFATNIDPGAKIYFRNCMPVGQPNAGGGQFLTY